MKLRKRKKTKKRERETAHDSRQKGNGVRDLMIGSKKNKGYEHLARLKESETKNGRN